MTLVISSHGQAGPLWRENASEDERAALDAACATWHLWKWLSMGALLIEWGFSNFWSKWKQKEMQPKNQMQHQDILPQMIWYNAKSHISTPNNLFFCLSWYMTNLHFVDIPNLCKHRIWSYPWNKLLTRVFAMHWLHIFFNQNVNSDTCPQHKVL